MKCAWFECFERKDFMTTNQQSFIRLLACGFNDVNQTEEIVFDEKSVALTNAHKCEPIVYAGAVKCGVAVPVEWKYKALYGAINNEKKIRVQDKIIKKLEDAGIHYAILKGTSVARCYQNSTIRLLGDIDILVGESNYRRAIEIIAPNDVLKDHCHDFHIGVKVDGVTVEIHKYVTREPDSRHGKKIFEMMSELLDNTEKVEYDGHWFNAPTNKYQALVLLSHKRRHMDGNDFTMRMLCDWASFVSSVDIEEWKNDVYPFIKKADMHLFADAMTACADKYLGTNNSCKIIRNISNDIIDSLMNVLLSCGVGECEGGLSSGVSSIYEKNLRKSNRFVAVFKSLNDMARRQYKPAKYAICLPMYWIYIPMRYLFNMLTGKREKLVINQIDSIVKNRRKVYKNLDLD